jgi:hypothetical protein
MAMTPKQYELVEMIFAEACELPSARRGALLDERCGADPIVRREVEVMLAADDAGDDGFTNPEWSCGVTQADDEDPALRARAIPERIGAYRVIRECGHGGMGVVYEAEQDSPRRRVALKVIKLGMDTKRVIARFEAERQALAMMDHPHIAKVFDAGSTDTGRVRGWRSSRRCATPSSTRTRRGSSTATSSRQTCLSRCTTAGRCRR